MAKENALSHLSEHRQILKITELDAFLTLTTRPNAMILSMHSREKRTVKAVLRCFRTVSYAVGAE